MHPFEPRSVVVGGFVNIEREGVGARIYNREKHEENLVRSDEGEG
jgi:hypothetical protein